jgi:Putative amidoligase enzyme
MILAEYFGFGFNEKVDATNHPIFGIECEIEGVQDGQYFTGFDTTKDGSLRHNGYEFISCPMPMETVLTAFRNLHSSLLLIPLDEGNFSRRTSTHVHMNCRSLTAEQVKTMVMLYALFEEVFFLMVDKNRRGNIHCVPLTETFLPSKYSHSIHSLRDCWHKYTALNILPLSKQGTIEFRHLQGTNSVELLEEWLTCLGNLWYLCQTAQLTPETLTNKETIVSWFKDIFGGSKRVMVCEAALDSLIENTLLDVKFSLV